MKNVSDILRMGGSGANVVNLVLLVVIGWNARDALEDTLATVEKTELSVVELRADNKQLREDFGDLRDDVVETEKVRKEFEDYRSEMDAKIAKLVTCVKSRNKCEL